MAQVFEIALAHAPPSTSVFAALFTSVRNAAFLREQLLKGNSDFEYAFIDAGLILSTTHVLAAVFRAVRDALHNRLRTRNVHSEVVFSLSPNNNIAESFRRFGITDSTTALLAIKVVMPLSRQVSSVGNGSPVQDPPANQPTLASVKEHLTVSVQGTPLAFDDHTLAELTDMAAVRKAYKLNAGNAKIKGRPSTGSPNVEVVNGHSASAERDGAQVAVLAMMALKGS